jgi:hypothetical protein
MKKENKEKFENVFSTFNQPKDSLKLKAAYFLIENMEGLGFYKGRQIDDYNTIFDILANKPSDYRENLPWYANELSFLFDSLRNIYGPMDYRNFYFVKDEDAISAEFLIDYINKAFMAWENPWSKKFVSFSDFCNYVLPYRNLNEPIEDWRSMFVEKYKWVYDSVKPGNDIIEVADMLNVGSELKYSNGFGNYIVSIPPSLLLEAMYADCSNTSNYKAMVLRAHGIPATIDYFPQYGSDHNAHYWNSVMDRNGNYVSYEEALHDITASVAYKYKISKVFRKTFSKNPALLKLIQDTKGDVPSTFLIPRFIDVTSSYVSVTDVKIKLDSVPENCKYVYAAVFNDASWTAIDFAPIENKQWATFKNLGRDVLYLPLYHVNGKQVPTSLPFKISNKGYIQYLEPKSKKTMVTLTRKYHFYKNKLNWLQCLKGGKFQGANRPDFSDATTLATIEQIPGEHYQELKSNSNGSFKYLRMMFSNKESEIVYDGDGASIAEIEFLTPDGKIVNGSPIGSPGRKYNPYIPKNCFDGDPITFFEDARPKEYCKFVGLIVNTPVKIGKIRFLARNDLNSIQKGNEYEIFFWDNKRFCSLGKKIASDTLITFDNVPENSVLWLRNLTAGKEERIFTWENGKQVWW